MSSLSTLRFEPLRENHIAGILAIESQVNSAPWTERSFRNELDHKQGIFRVGLIEGEVTAYGGLWLVIDEAHITTIAVSPARHRMGIGTRLMCNLLEEAKSQGMMCVTLEVRVGNKAAIQMYERIGFIVSAKRKGYYPDNKEDAIVMWLHELQTWNPPPF